MTTPEGEARPKATRRRGRVLEAAIREAVLVELRAHGYSGVTFANVAERAGTSRAVLYRRFPTRARLVVDALSESLVLNELRTAGPLRDDLRAFLGRIGELGRHFGPDVSRELLGDADNTALRTLLSPSRHSVQLDLEAIVDAARQRGELGPGGIPSMVLTAPVWLLRSQALDLTITDQMIDELVDNIALPLYQAHSADVPHE